MMVADVGDPGSLQVYSLTAGESASPVFTANSVGSAKIWDIEYDPINDRLYAAGTAGDILVYDEFFALGSGAIPTRTITPSTAASPSNIHGIVHVAATDQVIATDVNDAADAADGKLYVVDVSPEAVENTSKCANNRSERSHQSTRICENGMCRHESPGEVQRFSTVHAAIHYLLNLRRHAISASDYREWRAGAFYTRTFATA